jgi:hypothetical protein
MSVATMRSAHLTPDHHVFFFEVPHGEKMLCSGTVPESIKYILVYEDNVLESPRKTSSSRPTTGPFSWLPSCTSILGDI